MLPVPNSKLNGITDFIFFVKIYISFSFWLWSSLL